MLDKFPLNSVRRSYSDMMVTKPVNCTYLANCSRGRDSPMIENPIRPG